jgi:hypothetical protein
MTEEDARTIDLFGYGILIVLIFAIVFWLLMHR